MRYSPELAHRFVCGRLLPLRAKGQLSKNKKAHRLSRSRACCAFGCPWPMIPDGRLIAVADALVKWTNGVWYTWYFILVRSVSHDDAVALPPYCRKGTETVQGWHEAFTRVEPSILKHIVALVSDGHRGLVTAARDRHWLIQRCHFHLLARIQSRRSRGKIARHTQEADEIFSLVHSILSARNERLLSKPLSRLEEIGWHTTSADLKNTLKGFVNNYRDWRTYRTHPKLNLPVTNNTAEALIGMVEEVSRRARGFASLTVFNEWMVVVLKTRGRVKCRGRNQQN